MQLGDIVIHKPSSITGKLIVHGLSGGSAIRTEEGKVYNVKTKDLVGLFNLNIGDRVVKYKGDYTAAGEVRAAYTTKAGKVRYVVEYDALPLQHIHSDKDLMRESDWIEAHQDTFGQPV